MKDSLFVTKVLEPLSQEEILINFQKYYNGDMEAREKIINHNIRLVSLIISRMNSNMVYNKKELFSSGCLGLINAVDTFNANKGYSFSSYAYACIKNEIMVFIKKEHKHINNSSLEEIIFKDSGQTLGETILDDKVHLEEDYEKAEIYGIVRQCVNELPYTEKRVVLLYYGFIDNKSYTQEEIGKILNYSKQYVSVILKKAKDIITLKLKKNGIIEMNSHIKKIKK